VALLVEKEQLQQALIYIQVKHLVIDTASDHYILWPTKPQLLSHVANSAKGEDVVKSVGLILQRSPILVKEVSKVG
jgi:hypothetical protein